MIKKLLCANRLDGQKYIPNNLNVCNANIFLGNRAKRNSLINCFKSIRLCEVNNNRNRCRSGCAALCSQTAQMNWIKAIFIVIEFIPFHFYLERERDILSIVSVFSLFSFFSTLILRFCECRSYKFMSRQKLYADNLRRIRRKRRIFLSQTQRISAHR